MVRRRASHRRHRAADLAASDDRPRLARRGLSASFLTLHPFELRRIRGVPSAAMPCSTLESKTMSRSNTPNNTRRTAGMLGVALAGLVLSGSAFAVQPLAQGYMVAASHAAGEGKCGEGKCGATEGKTAKAATAKTAEGKCGEGKCGDASFAKTDTTDDGLVSRAEFLAVAPTRGADFPKLDVDSDGFISEKEAYDFLKATFAANGKPMPAGLFAKIK
jgi:uncharacterized low-complexity protein